MFSTLKSSQEAVGPLGLLWCLRFRTGTGAPTPFTLCRTRQHRLQWMCNNFRGGRLRNHKIKNRRKKKGRASRARTLSRSLACFSATLASLWLRRSSRLCCCSLKPFCFCSASVIHVGPASFSWTLELSKECLLCSDGFSVKETTELTYHSGGDDFLDSVSIQKRFHTLLRNEKLNVTWHFSTIQSYDKTNFPVSCVCKGTVSTTSTPFSEKINTSSSFKPCKVTRVSTC